MQQVLGSDLGQDSGYPNWSVLSFFSVSPGCYLNYAMIIFYYFSHGVRLGPFSTAATVWPIVPGLDDRWWWLRSNWWKEDWQGKPKYSEKNCPSVTLSTTNPTWPGLEPGLPRWEASDKPPELWHGLCYDYFQILFNLSFNSYPGNSVTADNITKQPPLPKELTPQKITWARSFQCNICWYPLKWLSFVKKTKDMKNCRMLSVLIHQLFYHTFQAGLMMVLLGNNMLCECEYLDVEQVKLCNKIFLTDKLHQSEWTLNWLV
jgi:hypothetical protein